MTGTVLCDYLAFVESFQWFPLLIICEIRLCRATVSSNRWIIAEMPTGANAANWVLTRFSSASSVKVPKPSCGCPAEGERPDLLRCKLHEDSSSDGRVHWHGRYIHDEVPLWSLLKMWGLYYRRYWRAFPILNVLDQLSDHTRGGYRSATHLPNQYLPEIFISIDSFLQRFVFRQENADLQEKNCLTGE